MIFLVVVVGTPINNNNIVVCFCYVHCTYMYVPKHNDLQKNTLFSLKAYGYLKPLPYLPLCLIFPFLFVYRQLSALPQHILQCDHVIQFFCSNVCDGNSCGMQQDASHHRCMSPTAPPTGEYFKWADTQVVTKGYGY